MTTGQLGTDTYGTSPLGSGTTTFGVQSATALSTTIVEVFFTDLVDFTYAPVLNPSNYTIIGLSVLGVVQLSAISVGLTTSTQDSISYVVTVADAKSVQGSSIDRSLHDAIFTGSTAPSTAGFFAVATARRRVRAVFSTFMLNDANLVDPASYTIKDLSGNAVTILAVALEQSLNPLSVVMTLGADLGAENHYVCTVSSNVKTESGLQVVPNTSVFQWVEGAGQMAIPMGVFSGEVTGGLFGTPAGLVFFSPALDAPAANSIIQIDEIDVCTTAFDTYTLPQPIDPPSLYTYGGAVQTPIGPTTVLWAPFPRNFEARFEIGFSPQLTVEPMPQANDGSCSVVLRQPFNPAYVSLLNDPAWYLFNNTGTTVPPTFITANNLAPIPQGATTIIVLNEQLVGDSTMTPPAAAVQLAAHAQIAGNSQVTPTPS